MEFSSFFALSAAMALSFSVAYFLGDKREIGASWSLFFCIMFSPILGAIITLYSPPIKEVSENEKRNPQVGIWSVVYWSIGLLCLLVFIYSLINQFITQPYFSVLSVSVGFIGSGFYTYDPQIFNEEKNN